MMPPDTETRLRTMVAEHYCVDDDRIQPNAEFEADLGGDNLDCIEFAMRVEEEFQIELTDDEAEDALRPDGTFGKLCELVERKLGEAVNG
jgi:acyl carrier protein